MTVPTTPSDPAVEAFIDIEAAGLRPDDPAWEVAMLRRAPGQPDALYLWHIADFDPSKADPTALKYGGFYKRHPMHVILDPTDTLAGDRSGSPLEDALLNPERARAIADKARQHPAFSPSGPDLDVVLDHKVLPEYRVASQLERLVRDAVVWACNPVYDVPRLTALLNRHSRAWTAEYRPMCATTFAAGAATARGLDIGQVPYDNARVGAALGVDRHGFGQAHTGIADCYYAAALVDAVRALVPATA